MRPMPSPRRSMWGACCALALVAACGSGDDDPGSTPDTDGGTEPSTFGVEAGSDKTSSGGGSSSSGNGGTAPEGGSSGDGGDDGGGGGDAGPDASAPACVGSVEDPAAAATVSSYIDKLTGTKPTGVARTQIIDAIIKSCHVFAPSVAKTPGWQRQYCWAHLVSSISKESSYNAGVTVSDAYAKRAIGAATANDPVVGLLQIRFSSTVHDYVALGHLDNLSCVGCNFPASFATHKAETGNSTFWAVTGPSQNLPLMKSVACNVGLGAWYYYVYGTGNGKASAATHLGPYCNGQGTAANIVTGLRSHLEGPDPARGVIPDMNGVNALQAGNPNAYGYITSIKTLFDLMIPAPPGKHPFFITLPPSPSQYCR